jgi:hypothetical protein
MTEKKLGTSLCDRCKKNIQGNPDDPVNITSEGCFHNKCMREHYQALAAQEAEKEAKKAAKKVKVAAAPKEEFEKEPAKKTTKKKKKTTKKKSLKKM